MNRVIFDDIGSYPLPGGTTKKWLKEAFAKIELPPYKDKLYLSSISEYDFSIYRTNHG